MAHKYKTERDLIETCATILAERLKKQRNEQGLTLQFKQSEIDPLGSITFSGKISPLQRAYEMARQVLTSLAPGLPGKDKSFNRLIKIVELEASRRLDLNNHGPYS